MKLKSILFVCMLTAASAVLHSCKKDERGDDNTPVEEKIEQAYQEIKSTADAILLSDDPVAGFDAIAEQYRAMEEVAAVEARTDGLFVKFSDDRVCAWFVPTDVPFGSTDDYIKFASILEKVKVRSAENSGNKKTGLINQQAGEAGREYNDYYIFLLDSFYTLYGWDVTQVIGPDVTLDFIRNGLSDYDAVYYIAHGFEFEGLTYVLTNSVESNKNDKTVGVRLVRRDDRQVVSSEVSNKVAFSGNFIKNNYAEKAFHHSCIYMVACQSMGIRGNMNYSMASAFVDHGGAGVYIGWDETNYSGQSAGCSILLDLLDGKTLSAAVKHLEDRPGNWRVNFDNEENDDPEDKYYTATLQYYPATAGDYRLFAVDFSFLVNGLPVSEITANSDFRLELRPSTPVEAGYFKVWYHWCMEGCVWGRGGQGYGNMVLPMESGKTETLYAQYFNAEGNPISEKKGLIVHYNY
jgi:hypothetical protein